MLVDWFERRSSRVVPALSAALGALMFLGTGSAVAQQGAIAGTVTDAESLRPVAGAQVFVPGTVLGTLTGEAGTFRIEGVPAGQVTVTIRLIGYKEASQEVTVAAGQVATADFQVQQTALRLQDIVVTGVVAETPRVKLPFQVERLDPDDLPVPTADVSSLLSAKAPGVSVVQGSGQPGQAADIILRGPTSIDASGRSQSPLIVIDGVIQSENATLADVGAMDVDHVEIVKGSAAASLYGSRAQNGVIQITTKRGSNLQTNTFELLARGEYGVNSIENTIDLTNSHSWVTDPATGLFVDSEGNLVDFGDLGRMGFGSEVFKDGGTPNTAFQDGAFPVPLIDQIGTFFDPGETYSVYGALTGRSGESSFRVSFDHFDESGVVNCSECPANLAALNADRIEAGLEPFGDDRLPKDDGYRRQNARLNVDTRFGDIDVAASGFYSRSYQDDTATQSGAFFTLTFMSKALDLTELTPDDGRPKIDVFPLSLQHNPLYELSLGEQFDERTRTMGSIDVAWSPTSWFSLESNASFDRTDFESTDLFPKSQKEWDGGASEVTFPGGSLDKFNFTDEAINASVTASYNQTFNDGDYTVRAKARYLVEDQSYEDNGVEGSQFVVEGVPRFEAISGAQEGDSEFRDIKAQGYFGIVSLDYRSKYILDGLVRRDGSSLFGPEERWATYFRGSAAWRLSQEDWWNIGPIDEFKLRFSYGTAGGRPNFRAQYETFGVQAGQIFPINLGNRALKPEFSVEREFGVNMVLAEQFGIDYTYAWQTTDDQLLNVPQAAFVGFSSQWQNAGEIEAKTHEIGLRWAAIDQSETSLNFRLNWDRTDQEVTRLDVPDFTQAGTDFFVYEGAQLGEFWGHKFASSCADLAHVGVSASDCSANFQVNDDGLLVFTGGADFTSGIAQGLWGTTGDIATPNAPVSDMTTYDWGLPITVQAPSPACLSNLGPGETESSCALQDFLPVGSGQPDWNASFATNFRYKGLSLNGLLDASVGHQIYNNTGQWGLRDNHGAIIDQAGKPEGLKKPVGYYVALYDVNSLNSWFVEDGDWLKVRELSVGYTLPQSFIQNTLGNRLDRVTLNLIGRNLLTFTDYTGYDPEVGAGGGEIGAAAINRQDNFGYPNFRTFTAALEIVF